MEENTELLTVDTIRKRVYVNRGQQVMLDFDLAEIYAKAPVPSMYMRKTEMQRK